MTRTMWERSRCWTTAADAARAVDLTPSFVIDLTDAIQRVYGSGSAPGGTVNLLILPVPVRGQHRRLGDAEGARNLGRLPSIRRWTLEIEIEGEIQHRRALR